ncbi:uncharacterized protein N7459_005050 [Penicillium hispanicum]|uniref:uncharacterized protein n=1 Tax=Penicillium hispanicum TaxID=1080232 RepID=UPI00253FE9B1|nr:uncharacterized protein N7459_005050 [Penicillium hispanicum]KAJ5585250.1 hypothetical protein N7459_005050 [Penicillium hispanicum]
MVNGRPEMAAFDAIFGRSLTVGGLGVIASRWLCLVPGSIILAYVRLCSSRRRFPYLLLPPPGGVREPKMAPLF